MRRIWLGFLIFFQASPKSFTTASSSNSSQIKILLQNYDGSVRPGHGGPPVNVSVGMYVLTIERVDERNMDFTIVFFMRHYYKDPRLTYTATNMNNSEPIILSSNSDWIWTPDTYVVNNKDQSVGREHELFYIYPDGNILFSKRFSVRATCQMDLRKFPLDEQICGIEIESCEYLKTFCLGHCDNELFKTSDSVSYSEKSTVLSWLFDDPSKTIEIHKSGKWMVRFHIAQWKLKQTKKKYFHGTDTHSNLVVEFVLSRKVLFFILQFYIPTFLIVMTSWVSFWVDNSSIPGRVGLSITTVLAMTTLMYGVQSSLPQVPYTKAIDIFLIASFLFVFSALIEFAAVSFHQKTLQKEKGKRHFALKVKECDDQNKPTEVGRTTSIEEPVDKELKTSSNLDLQRLRKRTIRVKPLEYYLRKFTIDKNMKPDIVDRVSRVAFPVLFFVFNLAYWLVFLLP